MSSRVQVFKIETKSGVSRKTGLPWSMDICSALVLDTGDVGEFNLPRGHEKIVPGVYDIDLGLARSAEGKLEGVITKISRVAAAAPGVAPQHKPA